MEINTKRANIFLLIQDWTECKPFEKNSTSVPYEDNFTKGLKKMSRDQLGRGFTPPYLALSTMLVKLSTWAIVEETLTSGKYITLFLISIFKIYIYEILIITWQPA